VTSSLYTTFSSSLTQQEALLNKLETEISTGYSVQTPDQGPAAYEQATLGNDQISALTSETQSQANIQSQLNSVSNVYGSMSSVFSSLQGIIEQALNGTTSAQNMQSLAPQVAGAEQELMGLGNTLGPNGTYLFGGTRGSIPPFRTGSGGAVTYVGDGGQSQAAISPDTTASTLANGEVFMTGLSGDGYGSATAGSANKGNGVLVSTGVSKPSSAQTFQSGSAAINVAISSASGTLIYTATQGSGSTATTISHGPVSSGMSLQLDGMDYTLNGTPASGDSFQITPSKAQSVFSLVQTVYNALAGAGSSPAQRAQTDQTLNTALSSLSGYQQSVLTAQAQTGVTLQAVTNAGTSNGVQSTTLQNNVQTAVGVNTPVVLTQIDNTMTAMQAAMKAFSDATQLNIFNYI
jgi:flagellar hook-associated protein 3 FlgL